VKPLGDPVERQADFEVRLGDHQIPELVLQHDGHLFGILLVQPLGDAHARRAGVERDVEMMLARQHAGFGDVNQHPAHDGAQRLLGQQIIADVVDGHAVGPVLASWNGTPWNWTHSLNAKARAHNADDLAARRTTTPATGG
jgi:hypothetical protein